MGLETTEILMAVEDEFHVRIEGEEAYRIQTVGDLNQFVIARRGASVKKGSCGTLRAFLQVRYALSSQFSVPERNIRPSTDLRALLPWKRRRTEWRKLQRRFPSLPDLSPSRGSQTVIVLGGFAVACALVVVTIGAARGRALVEGDHGRRRVGSSRIDSILLVRGTSCLDNQADSAYTSSRTPDCGKRGEDSGR